MSVSFDGKLSSLNIDLEDLMKQGLTGEELEQAILDAIPEGLSADEQAELLTEVLTDWEALCEGVEDELDELDEEIEDTESDSRLDDLQDDEEDLKEALEYLESVDEAIDDAFEHVTLLSYETASEMAWTTNGLNNGESVTIKCTGTSANQESLWGDDSTEALTDLNLDGLVTYADEELRRLDEANALLASSQPLYLGAAGEKFHLKSPTGPAWQFSVTNSDGITVDLNIDGNPATYFEPGTVDMDELASWPEELLKICYERGDTMSFYDHLNTGDLSNTEKLAFVETYSDVSSQANFDTIYNTVSTYINEDYTMNLELSKDELQNYYESSVDILYTAINDPTVYDSMSEAWSAVFASWTEDNLSANAQRAIIEALILGIGFEGGQTFFQSIFAGVVSTLEDMIDAPEGNINTLDKALIVMLEHQSGGVGNYGGSAAIWTQAFATLDEATGAYTQGPWKDNAENIDALNLAKSLYSQTAFMLTTAEMTAAIETETAMLQQEEDEELNATDPEGNPIHRFNVSLSKSSTFMAKTAEYADRFGDGWSDGSNKGPLQADMEGLITTLANLGTCDIDVMRDAIISYIGATDSSMQDDLAMCFIMMVRELDRDLYWDLCRDKEFRDLMWGFIDNGDDTPDEWESIAESWNNAYEDNDGAAFTEYKIRN